MPAQIPGQTKASLGAWLWRMESRTHCQVCMLRRSWSGSRSNCQEPCRREGPVGYRNIRYKCYAKGSHGLPKIRLPEEVHTHACMHATQAEPGARSTPSCRMPTDNGSNMPLLGPMACLLLRTCHTLCEQRSTSFAITTSSRRHIALHTTNTLPSPSSS